MHALALTLSWMVTQAGPCADGEVRVLSCKAKAKVLAVCAGPASSPAWLQVRLGAPGRPELVFPADTTRGFGPFAFERRTLATGTATTLTFTHEGTTREVWSQDGKDGGMGINVLVGGRVTRTVACTADLVDDFDVVADRFGPAAAPAPAGGPRPDPLAGRSPQEVCNDDALLLLKYSFDELRSHDGFKKRCCVKGALGDDDRCQLDWPSSDVMACSDVDLWRNRIFALYGYTFKDPKFKKYFEAQPWYQPRADFDASWLPPVAQQNVAALKALVKDGGCVADTGAATAPR
jgi:hypothetical protein